MSMRRLKPLNRRLTPAARKRRQDRIMRRFLAAPQKALENPQG